VPQTAVQTPERRPVLVAVIFWFHVLAALSFVWIFFRLATGHARLRPSTTVYVVASIVLMAVKMWGAIALYRLRRSAVPIFLSSVLLNLPVTIYDIYHHQRGYQPSSILAMFAGVVIAAGTCVYALYLARIGTLR
jgi:hypothetical protein